MAVDNYTIALLHMNGTDASTTFTDDSGKTWTAVGNAQIDTAQSKFGGASGLFDGSGDYISTPDAAAWNLGSSDFTIDFWIRINSLPSAGNAIAIFSQRTDVNNGCRLNLWNSGGNYYLHFQVYIAGVESNFSTNAVSWSTNTWYHCAAVRSGNTGYLFRDGVIQSQNIFSITIPDFTGTVYIGNDILAGYVFDGWIDEFRFSVGVARWKTAFTPPVAAYSGYYIYPEIANFILTGQVANLVYPRTIIASYGSFTLTGQAALFVLTRKIIANYGAFTLSGQTILTSLFRTIQRLYVLSTDLSKKVKGTDTGMYSVDSVDYRKLIKRGN